MPGHLCAPSSVAGILRLLPLRMKGAVWRRCGSACGAGGRVFDEVLLAVYWVLATGASRIATVGMHVARFHCVGKVGGEDLVAEMADQFGFADGEDYLDSAVQVSRHQVGAAEIDLFLARIAEIVDSAVLEEAAHDAGYLDVFAYAFDSGAQAADPTHQQINLHASLRCFIEQADGALVDQGVHLENQVPTLASALMLDLALDQAFQLLSQINGATSSFAVFAFGGIAGEVVEQVGAVRADFFVAGEHSEIGVELRGNAVVVAGATGARNGGSRFLPGARPARSCSGPSGPAVRRPRARPRAPALAPTRCCSLRRSAL